MSTVTPSPLRRWWVNHDAEGVRCSVGPFRSLAIADLFRAMAFADPAYGSVDPAPDGETMTVAQQCAAFRFDLNESKGTVPAGGWHA